MPRTEDIFNRTMIRVKDPQASFKFYTEALGMGLVASLATLVATPGRCFSHIAIFVDHIEKACARFESLGVRFQKLTDSKMRNIAFILDLDGYWVEIVSKTLKLPA